MDSLPRIRLKGADENVWLTLLYPANPLGDVPQLVFAFTQILAKLAGGFGLRGRLRR